MYYLWCACAVLICGVRVHLHIHMCGSAFMRVGGGAWERVVVGLSFVRACTS